eukprot:643236-Pelagomonas_calceolata.AAC.1
MHSCTHTLSAARHEECRAGAQSALEKAADRRSSRCVARWVTKCAREQPFCVQQNGKETNGCAGCLAVWLNVINERSLLAVWLNVINERSLLAVWLNVINECSRLAVWLNVMNESSGLAVWLSVINERSRLAAWLSVLNVQRPQKDAKKGGVQSKWLTAGHRLHRGTATDVTCVQAAPATAGKGNNHTKMLRSHGYIVISGLAYSLIRPVLRLRSHG